MARCQKCNKGRSMGRKSRHRRGVASKKFANKATKKGRSFKPNLQKITFMAGGLTLTMLLCTRCIKKMKQGKKKAKIKGQKVADLNGGGSKKATSQSQKKTNKSLPGSQKKNKKTSGKKTNKKKVVKKKSAKKKATI